jgi:hypothetical protein
MIGVSFSASTLQRFNLSLCPPWRAEALRVGGCPLTSALFRDYAKSYVILRGIDCVKIHDFARAKVPVTYLATKHLLGKDHGGRNFGRSRRLFRKGRKRTADSDQHKHLPRRNGRQLALFR